MRSVDSCRGGLGFAVNYRLFFACLVLFLGLGGTSAVTLDVPSTYSTIQAAINAANIGDTINVSAGTYNENVDVNKSVNLVGAGADVTIVNASNSSDHVFEVTANWVNVSGFTVMGGNGVGTVAGIYSNLANNTKVSDSVVINNKYGIYLKFSENNTLTNNTASNNGEGIRLDSSSGNTLTNNTANSNNYDGIHLRSSSNNNLTRNTASNNSYGILLDFSSNNALTNNNASNNDGGIFLGSSSNNNTLKDNTVDLNNYDGISLRSSSRSTLTDNTANSNNLAGIGLYDSSGNTLTNNTALNNSYNGIRLGDSSNNTITNNTALNNSYNGIHLGDSSNNTITNNTALNNRYDGILLSSSSNNTLTNNTVLNNDKYGIRLGSSSSNTLKNNTMSLNTYNFWIGGYRVSHYVQTIDTTNTVDGKPIYYLVGAVDQMIDSGTGAGYVGVVNGINVTVKDLALTKNGEGMLFANTSNSFILNVNASNNYRGIYLDSSNNNTLNNNTVSNNDYGIHLRDSSSNTLTDNTANSNNNDGIYLYSSSNNTIANNNASNNNRGIYLRHSSNNTITNNNVSDNWYRWRGGYGIGLGSSSNNTLSNNNASNNNYGIYLESSSSNTIQGNAVSGNSRDGIYIYNSSNTVTGNTANSNAMRGISIESSSGNALTDNTVPNNWVGIYLYSSSSNNTLTNNNASNNDYGIYLGYSSSNTLTDNNMSANTYNFYVDGNFAPQTIDTSNTVDGKPIYYLVGVSDMVMDSSINAGYVGIVNGVNVTVKDLTLTKNGQGVLFVNTSNSTVLNVNASNNDYGIYLASSSSNNLTSNTASNNYDGIYLYSSSNNNLTGNTMSANAYNFYIESYVVGSQGYPNAIDTTNMVDGKPIYYLIGKSNMVVDSSTNAGFVGAINSDNITVKGLTLTKNSHGVLFYNTNNSKVENVNASNNRYGISLSSSSSNNLTNNNASNNNRGIYLSYSSKNNLIYNNYFNNFANFNFRDTIYSNAWNTTNSTGPNIVGGPYLGGNFWAKPNGYGFSETCEDADSDGICDSSYTVASGNVDYLPLAANTTRPPCDNTGGIVVSYSDGGREIQSSGAMWKSSKYPEFLSQDIWISATGSQIRVKYGVDNLDDDSTNGDDYYQVYDSSNLIRDPGGNSSNAISLTGIETDNVIPYVRIAGDGLKFDANGNGDLDDSIDYILYDSVYVLDGADGVIRFAYDLSDHRLATFSDGDGEFDIGEVVEIKGWKYAFTRVKFDENEVSIGPVIVKTIYDGGPNADPNHAVVIAENYKIFFENDTRTLYFYQDNVLLDEYSLPSTAFEPYKLNDKINAGEFEDKYNIFLINYNQSEGSVAMSFVDKDQTFDINDEDEGIMGYDFVWVNNEDWPGEIVFFSPAISLVKGDTIDLDGTYFKLKWTPDKELDIKREATTNQSSGALWEASEYPDFLTSDVWINISDGSCPACSYSLTWLPPLSLNKSSNLGSTIPIKFTLNDTNGSFAVDESVLVEVYNTTGDRVFNETYGDGDDDVRIDPEQYYITNMHTSKTWPEGNYTVKVSFDDTLCEFEWQLTLEKKGMDHHHGSGSGGGGSHTSFEAWVKNVSPGQTFILEIDDEDIPYLKGLSLTTKQAIYSSKLSITDYDKKPWYSMAEPDANVFRYFKVSYDKKNDVQNASFDFRVNRSWLEDSNISQYAVKMYRYTTGWDELGTEFIKEDDEWVYLKAKTPGFSYFSIGGETGSGYKPLEEVSPIPIEEEPGTVEPPEVETPTPASPVETSEPDQGPEKAPKEGKGGICGPTVVVLISMLVLLFTRGMREMKR